MQCSYFDAGVCRSCTLMGTEYSAQLADKQHDCKTLLAAHSRLEWLSPITSSEAGFRNKAKMAVGGTVDSPTLGILDAQKSGVDLRGCGVLQPGLRDALPRIACFISQARIAPYDVAARRGELKYVLLTEAPSGELMLRFVLRSREALSRIRKHLPGLQRALPRARMISVNLQPEHKAVLEGDTEIPLTPATTLAMRTNTIDLRLGAKSFFQTNTAIAEHLYTQAADWCAHKNPRSVWDLYCGVGGFALHVAAGARHVTGIEVSAEAIESATATATAAGIGNVRFIADNALRFAHESRAADIPDLAIVNPPRRGIGTDLAHWLDDSAVQTVIYSSCNAVSLARDLEAMPALAPVQARLFDMFPQTRHYETMVLLERR
ncbi:23S rRNA (uracil(747)-C(5))-methyltransferase RlmC [Microbacterium sp. MPKO10]|uniref:23S rRNA (uracil(747)-C(5))-methyltransferase RlmC n=1 Tax=Microbacterium sp. MPKO10 TaxID=2989818 RepID=UPI0022358952|nr:23S rRNA (uracil(747)-C(5))-methyltransferase RlmC [Microbacterium sp. MPKO10]MCW4459744.1 23S rRNA (uracil(747)-C(5))-methyltransferase RlmC [Microbacterium sp. MPKO10]